MWTNKKNVFVILAALVTLAIIAGFLPNSSDPKKPSIFIEEVKITVREGFCLSEISHDLGADWKEVAKLNNIENPDLIQPGQKLNVYAFKATNVVTVSWYGAECHGKTMANGETYNMNDITTVAHKWLPFGTRVRLTRLDNNKYVELIVKDRGPYMRGRIFDISKAAAEKLGMIDEGLTLCMVEILPQ